MRVAHTGHAVLPNSLSAININVELVLNLQAGCAQHLPIRSRSRHRDWTGQTALYVSCLADADMFVHIGGGSPDREGSPQGRVANVSGV